ncbi:hypothetical protein [Knoellia aerolata]|uniref:hypothetical protein n=1 Tax=Knoellia aerolata TaxID=442954 RepID=UPI000AEE6957|nr:hypothetical protein [Knoellia aerolata]
MKKAMGAAAVISLAAVLQVSVSNGAHAHNRAHVILPSGECMVVGSEKSVTLPDGSLHDLRPETFPADEIGTAYAADEGGSRLLKGGCP